jgi:hypothetical protein
MVHRFEVTLYKLPVYACLIHSSLLDLMAFRGDRDTQWQRHAMDNPSAQDRSCDKITKRDHNHCGICLRGPLPSNLDINRTGGQQQYTSNYDGQNRFDASSSRIWDKLV